jgi:hypothetical protein
MVPEALEVGAPPPQVDAFWLDALDLLEVPDLVAHRILIDPVVGDNGRTRFWFRFVGTRHLPTFGPDVTGRFVDELYGDPLAMRSEQALDDILATGAPHYWRRPSVFHGPQLLLHQRIMAPLADEAGRIVRPARCHDTADA